MKVVILAGGLGTRLSEQTKVNPKPLVEIGGRPILWHIMKLYSAFGFREFVVALGHKGERIKDFFINYRHRSHGLTVNLASGSVEVHDGVNEDWIVHLVDTGINTQTGGRIRRAAQFIGKEPFLLTYGDGLANVNITELIDFHRRTGKKLTVTAVRPPARFGGIVFNDELVSSFHEKSQVDEGWINGGFFVVEPEAVEYVAGDESMWEREPMEQLVQERQLAAYRHEGFWQCMDTLRDVRYLESLWSGGSAPWKLWK